MSVSATFKPFMGTKKKAPSMLEAVFFIGIQASGKSSMYYQRFRNTHVQINLDSLHTRNKERLLLQKCIDEKHSFVVDNTNSSRAERAAYIKLALQNGYKIIGYYFRSVIAESIERNKQRSGKEKIPRKGIISTAKRLEKPLYEEGFDELYYVMMSKNGDFLISKWEEENNEV